MNVIAPSRRPTLLPLALAATLGLSACGGGDAPGSRNGGSTGAATSAPQSQSGFPVTFTNADGTTTQIPARPQRILSTSTSITGTLLAVGAPVVASASNAKGEFFAQWADVAEKKHVENAWPAGKVDIEAATAADPDLIVVSTSGADSAMDQVDQLKAIAPVVVLDYGKQTWQDLARQVGRATGTGQGAEAAIADYDRYVAAAKAKITVPEGAANIVAYNGPTDTNPIGKGTGPHADVLKRLGFTVEEPDPAWHTTPQKRNDFVFASYENLAKLTAPTTFVLAADQAGAEAMKADKVLANVPSVKRGQVYGLGKNSFRVDYYSAKEMVDAVVAAVGA